MYPDAVDALEARLASDPSDAESVLRQGFNLWYAVVEDMRMGLKLPIEQYATRFMALYGLYAEELSDNADFCCVFGLGISMFWHYFPDATEEQGNHLLKRARELDPFWAKRF